MLFVNGALVALNAGYLGDWKQEIHEPYRIKGEKNTERLKLVPVSTMTNAIEDLPKKSTIVAVCLEIGNFTMKESEKFQAQLKSFALVERSEKFDVTDLASNMVYLPPLGSKDAADKKAAQLRQLKIEDFYIVQDQSPLRWSISLGVFKTTEAAKAYVAALAKKGLLDAKIAPRTVSAAKFAYRLRDLTAEDKATVERIQKESLGLEVHDCKPKSE